MGSKTAGLLDRVLKRKGDDVDPVEKGAPTRPVVKAGQSLSERIEAVSGAWYEDHNNRSGSSSWTVDVGDDYVIVRDGEDYKRVPYSTDSNGEITFDESNATDVKREWVEKAADIGEVEIRKTDDERQIVFGWASVAVRKDGTIVVDSQDDWIRMEDLEDAAYVFNLAFREGDEAHGEEVVAHLVESFVATPEKLEKMGLEGDSLPQGWWVGFYVPDQDVYAKCKPGPDGAAPEYEMFSIGGLGVRHEEEAG